MSMNKLYKLGLLSGSFDPITRGHEQIIKQATNVCEKIIVCIFINPEKNYYFSIEKRLNFIKSVINKYNGVQCDYYDGFVSDYCLANNVDIILRGFRDNKDYLYEVEMAKYNKSHCGVDTMIFPAEEELKEISSSAARDKLKNYSDYFNLLPKEVLDILNRDKTNF